MEGKELGLPWRIASQNYETCFYVIHGKDYTATDGREIQILCMQYGPHPIKEHKDRIKANAEIIVEAVNNYTQLHSELEKAKELLIQKDKELKVWQDMATGFDESISMFKKMFDNVQYDSVGLGCGIEDNNIQSRYDAGRYGFEDALDKVKECIPELWND